MSHPTSLELFATICFGLAVLHTFSSKRVLFWCHRFPSDSMAARTLHFLAEPEIIFGLWAAAFFLGLAVLQRSIGEAVNYVESLNFIEPKFVLVVMVVAATKPVVKLAETVISLAARLLPFEANTAFYFAGLSLGPLLGSFITEPAAMTLLALVLKRRYFDRGITPKFAYATLGLLFVNVSVGGTLTHFAAPPVLMIAAKWNWNTPFMLTHFGWRAAASCLVSAALITLAFRKELARLTPEHGSVERTPVWLTGLHMVTLGLVVFFAHHPEILFGVLVVFVGLVYITRQFQDPLKIKEGLLVGFFLAGLVVLGSPQAYWLKPLLERLNGGALFFGATALTAITDNAALTYLGGLVEGISDELKYALVAGAVTGGGLTVIANAPNPAGIGILQDAKVFAGEGISPLGLFLGALFPTVTAIAFFWLLH
jgi:hypothetical protein